MKNQCILLLVLTLFSCNGASDPDTSLIEEDISLDGEIEIVFENDKENGINIVFMGDAYLKSDLDRENGSYRQEAMESINALFNTHPFFEYKEHFNAYIVYVESREDVINPNGPSHTAFGTTIKDECASGLSCMVISFYYKVDHYMRILKGRNRRENDLVLLSVNNMHGGSAQYGSRVAIYGRGNYGTMVHEVGHAFSGLGDEYVVGGFSANLAQSTRYRDNLDEIEDLRRIKWKRFIGLDGYEDVGAFEGGNYQGQGVWRPEEISVMQSSSFLHFNAPSRASIVKRIYELRGLPYNFEDFLEVDRAYMNRRNFRKHEPSNEYNFQCGITFKEGG